MGETPGVAETKYVRVPASNTPLGRWWLEFVGFCLMALGIWLLALASINLVTAAQIYQGVGGTPGRWTATDHYCPSGTCWAGTFVASDRTANMSDVGLLTPPANLEVGETLKVRFYGTGFEQRVATRGSLDVSGLGADATVSFVGLWLTVSGAFVLNQAIRGRRVKMIRVTGSGPTASLV